MRLIILLFLSLPLISSGQIAHNKHLISDNYDDPSSPYVIDINNDGHQDILTVGGNNHDVTWWENNDTSAFVEHTINGSFTFPHAIVGDDIDQDGDIDVVAGSWWTDRIAWWSNDGNSNFSQANVVTGYDGAWGVNSADLDGDGDIDVLGTAQLGDELSWFENDGNENFSLHTIDGSLDGAAQIRAVDIDFDGDMDICGFGYLATELNLYLNDGSQTFTKATVDTAINSPQKVVILDMDQDNDLDLILISAADGLIMYENTSGNLDFQKIVLDASFRGMGVDVADYDNDLDIDVIATSNILDELVIFTNDGTNQFVKQVIDSDLAGPGDLVLADMDSDGDMDIVLCEKTSDEIYWYEQFTNENTPPCTQLVYPTAGSNQVPVDTTLYWSSANTALGYRLLIGSCLGCNDILDTLDVGLVTQYPVSNLPYDTHVFVQILPYNSHGETDSCLAESFYTLPEPPPCTSLTSPSNGSIQVNVTASISWGAVPAADGYLLDIGTCETCNDIGFHIDVSTDTIYSVGFLPDTSWIFVRVSPYNIGGSSIGCIVDSFYTAVRPICIGDYLSSELFNFGTEKSIIYDIDSDADNDIIVPSSQVLGLRWYRNDGNANFVSVDIPGSLYPTAIHAADLDDDGDIDVVSGSSTEVGWFINNGSNQFTYDSIYSHDNIRKLVVEDLDGDGNRDIVIISGGLDNAAWLKNDGSQNFTFAYFPIGSINSLFSTFDLGDLDSDGDLDVLVPDQGEDVIHFLQNDGSGVFTNTNLVYSNIANPKSIDIADDDMDGDNDILIGDVSSDKVLILRNDGLQNFSETIIEQQAGGPAQVIFDDFDFDGDMDIITLCGNSNEVVCYFNSTNNYCKSVIFDSLQYLRDLSLGDFTGNNSNEIVLNTLFPSTTILLENNSLDPPCTSIQNGALTIYSCDGLFYNSDLHKGIEYQNGTLFEDYIKSGVPYHQFRIEYNIDGQDYAIYNSSDQPTNIDISTMTLDKTSDSTYTWMGMDDDLKVTRDVSIEPDNEIRLSTEICNKSGFDMSDVYFGDIMDFDNKLGCNNFSFYTDVVGSSISMVSVCDENYNMVFGSFDTAVVFSSKWGYYLDLSLEYNSPLDPNGQLVDGAVTTIKHVPLLSNNTCFNIEIIGRNTDEWIVFGCTNINAHNYNPIANTDDGSCITCEDGILNGDESQIDCGGSICDLCTVLGDDCPQTLNLSSYTIQEGKYKANNVILSNNTIQGDIETHYESGNTIELLPSFQVDLGVEFEAVITNCIPD